MPPQLESREILSRKDRITKVNGKVGNPPASGFQLGFAKTSTMVQVVDHSERRGPNVEQGGKPLQFMVPGFMKKVAESDDSRSFASEIDGKSRCAATQKAGYGV